MPKFRNTTSDTLLAFHTGQTAGPDEVITVPADQADAFDGHPCWEPVADLAPPPRKPTVDKES